MTIPKEIITIGDKLKKAGFESYLVGGSLRDLLLNRNPKDWDITTNAKPKDIQKIFPDSVYENNFGTVAIKTRSKESSLKIIEVTTFRLDGLYSDKRHPDEIRFTNDIKLDLARRDFTINAIAHPLASNKISTKNLVDPFSGLVDLESKVLRTVGNPKDRFSEDALRLLRAVRLSVELNFSIESKTFSALKNSAELLQAVAPERIRDEFVKIINTSKASDGVRLLQETNLLKFIVPELLDGVDCVQNKHHKFTVFDHNLRSLDYASKQNYSLTVRLAALFHDISKPKTKRGQGENATFYAHEIVGAKTVRKILERLHFSGEIIKDVTHLVRFHMFNYNVGEVSPAGVRRLLARVGIEYIDDLIKVREADRIGSGVPKAVPYKLRHLLFMIEKVRRDPISPKNIKLKGDRLMKITNLGPSPRVGMILHALLDEVIDEPQNNTLKYLEKRAKNLNKLTDDQLRLLMEQSKQKQLNFEEAVEKDLKGRHYVK